MQRLNLGDFELTTISDGIYHLDGGALFGVVPRVLWQKKVVPEANNLVPVGLNSLVVRTGRQIVLIETGIGNKLPDKMKHIYGQPAQLLDNLALAGIAREDVDVVINTHLHFDHCGWNTLREDGKIVPTFPNAQYYAQRGEWEHARRQLERDAVSYISANYDPLVESGQMLLLEADQSIVPGISVRVFPGHTRNMQAVLIESGGECACYISDLIPTSAHLDLTWVMAFDILPLETIESRKRYYAGAIAEKWLTIFTHDANTPWAYIERSESGKMGFRTP